MLAVKRRLAGLILSLALAPNLAHSAGAGDFAQETTQWLNNFELVAANSTLLEQLKDMYINTAPVTKFEWGQALTQVRKLHQIVQQGQAIAYSAQNLEQLFKRRYPGYQSKLDYFTAYADWANSNLDSILGVMKNAGLQTEQIEQEEWVMRILQGLDMISIGRRQVLQISNMIKNMQVNKLTKLQQLIMAQTQAMNSYQQFEIQTQAKRAAREVEFWTGQVPGGYNQGGSILGTPGSLPGLPDLTGGGGASGGPNGPRPGESLYGFVERLCGAAEAAAGEPPIAWIECKNAALCLYEGAACRVRSQRATSRAVSATVKRAQALGRARRQ